MKKSVLALLVLIMIGLGWSAYSSLQPPVWSGQTEDGKWTAIYREEGVKERWFGTLRWNEAGEPILTYRELKINGKHAAGDQVGDSRTERIDKDTEFVAFGGQPDNNDHLELILKWIEGDIPFEETIILQPNK